MNKRTKLIALVLVLVLIVSTLAACVPGPARKPYPNTGNNPNQYTAQTNNPNNTKTDGYQTSSLFSKLDYSYATIIPSRANVMSGLSPSSPTIGSLSSGDRVKVIGKLNGLYIINVPNTNTIGTIIPNHARLYSAIPGSTAPAPVKPIPTTTGTTGTTGAAAPGTGRTGTGVTGNVGNVGTTPTVITPGATGTTGMNQNITSRIPNTTGNTTNTGTTGTTGTTTNTATASGTLTADASRILQLCNAERAKVGAKPLTANADLTKLANMKSQDMVKNNYFSHQSPTYGSPFDMMKTYGISYMYAGENLAMNQSADGAHTAWMNSEGHRRNILNPDFTEIGIGIYPKGNGSFIYTQEFIGK